MTVPWRIQKSVEIKRTRFEAQRTLLETTNRNAIHRQRIILPHPLVLHDKLHEYQVQHLADAVERQLELLVPERVEPVAFDDGRLLRDGASGGWILCQRRG